MELYALLEGILSYNLYTRKAYKHLYAYTCMTDDLLELYKDSPEKPRWGILGVGLMPWDKKMYEALRKQVCIHVCMYIYIYEIYCSC